MHIKNNNSVRHNIMANFFGWGWSSLISLGFIPFFIKFIGVEAYGLIGIFGLLTALLSALDLGLSSTLSRQLSRLSVIEGSDQEARDLVRTFEVIYWGVGIVIGLVVVFLSPLIARHWIHSQSISVDILSAAIILMGLTLAFQWPASLYNGGLIGLQRQVLLNTVRAIFVTLQYGGVVFVLLFISPSILAFFIWQLFISVINTFVLSITLWRSLPGSDLNARFSKRLLEKNFHFAAGIMGITILATILTQVDKIILSKMLPLQFFGYYTLAFSLANILIQLVTPISSALFPRFSQIVAGGEEENMVSLYHAGCQSIAVMILPVAVTIAVFSRQILSVWLGDPITVQNTYFLLILIIIGTAINALVILPFTLQLAHGWTKLSLLKCTIAVLLLVPLMILLVQYYGALGAAMAWIILNLGSFFIEIPIMHQRLLKRETRKWYLFDVAMPMIITCAIIFLSRVLMPVDLSRRAELVWIFVTYLFCLFLLSVTVPAIRWIIRTTFVRDSHVNYDK